MTQSPSLDRGTDAQEEFVPDTDPYFEHQRAVCEHGVPVEKLCAACFLDAMGVEEP